MLGAINVHISTKQFKSLIATAILNSGIQHTLMTTKCAISLGINLKVNICTPVKRLAWVNIPTIKVFPLNKNYNAIDDDKITSDLPERTYQLNYK